MRLSHMSAAAGEPPTPEQIQQWRRRISPPDNELPAGVGLTALLGRSEEAAVGITLIEAFSAGFRFTLAVRVRQARPHLVHGGLHMFVSSHLPPGVVIALEDRLLLGIEYADGQRATTVDDMPFPGPAATADDQRLVLVQNGGGGGDLSLDLTYWVAPLPPEGPTTFVLAWPGFGIAESRTVLDGTAIRGAADRSQILWPPQPARQPQELPSPPRPSSGWFAEPSG